MVSLWSSRLPCATRPAVMPNIAAIVARRHGVTTADLVGPSRAGHLVTARQEAFWECRQHAHLSLPQIGRMFNRHHTTVLHGLRQHEARASQVALMSSVQNGYQTIEVSPCI